VVHGNEIHSIRYYYPHLLIGLLPDMETSEKGHCLDILDISLDIYRPYFYVFLFEI